VYSDNISYQLPFKENYKTGKVKRMFILYGIYHQILQKIKLLREINEIGAWVGKKS